jgi:hypothetical protein
MDYNGTYTITVDGVDIVIPVRYVISETVSVSPVSIVSYSQEALQTGSTVQYATLAGVTLFGALTVGLLFMLFLRMRV